MNIKDYISNKIKNLECKNLYIPDIELDPETIKVIMISEVPHENPNEGFYSKNHNAEYMISTRSLFEEAGIKIENFNDLINLGIYITTAVKTPKSGYNVNTSLIDEHLPILEAEIELFKNLKVIMLMGDVAKKAVNKIVKSKTKKNVIPAESTYKIRHNEYYWNNIKVFPSYILTGGNILIEKSKRAMISSDIRNMIDIIK